MTKTKPKPKRFTFTFTFTKETKGKLMKDKRAVSPVIAEILMVALAVVLAAVIGASAFGIAPSATTLAPQANLVGSSWSSSGFTLDHSGGEKVCAKRKTNMFFCQWLGIAEFRYLVKEVLYSGKNN